MSLFASHEARAVLPHVFRAFGRVDRGQYVGTDNQSKSVAVAWRHEANRSEPGIDEATHKRREAECTITRFEDHATYPGVFKPQLGATITIEDKSGNADVWKVESVEKQTESYSDLILTHHARMKVNRLEPQVG